MKKALLTIFILSFMLIGASAAELFPNWKTAEDGTVRWGYMNESGKQVVDFTYASADTFGENTLAKVTDFDGRVGAVDAEGQLVLPLREGVTALDQRGDTVAVRLADSTDFYQNGKKVFSAPVTAGFLSDGRLPYSAAQKDGSVLWGYLGADGKPAIAPSFIQAGAFEQGCAVVQQADGTYAVIDTTGKVTDTLPLHMIPRMEVYGGKLVVLSNGDMFALYSLETDSLVSDYIYQDIKPYYNGYTVARMANRWIILDLWGRRMTEEYYYYLTDMGGGAYAARGEDGSVSVIDSNGNLIYRAMSYFGGFEPFEGNLSWHGTDEGAIVFFSHTGGYLKTLKNAENPTIVSENCALVTQNGKRVYVRISDGKALYDTTRTHTLANGVKLSSVNFEKYLGMDKDGKEYGWYLSYPQLSGLASGTAQTKINAAIKELFLNGPSFAEKSQPVAGNYGFAVYGRVLVVWVNAVCGEDTVWNDNVALDMTTGAKYSIDSLYLPNGSETLRTLLPSDMPLSLFSFPRVTKNGVTYYNNYARGAYAEVPAENELTWEQLAPILNNNSDFYRALHGSLTAGRRFNDVDSSHWAYSAIDQIAELGFMQGDGTYFKPDASLTEAEAIVTMLRMVGTPPNATNDITVNVPTGKWYSEDLISASNAGMLTYGAVQPEKAITREKAICLLYTAARQKDAAKAAYAAAHADEILKKFTDAGEITAEYRGMVAAAAYFGWVQGANGALAPKAPLTRAEFAKLVTAMM